MDMARLTPQPKKMEDRRWKMAKAASACVSALWNDLRGKCAQENKTFRHSNSDDTDGARGRGRWAVTGDG